MSSIAEPITYPAACTSMTERAYRIAVVAAKLDELGVQPHSIEVGPAYRGNDYDSLVEDAVSFCLCDADEFTRVGDALGLGDLYRRGDQAFDSRIGVFEDVAVYIFGAEVSA
jgi:hypothetical protein